MQTKTVQNYCVVANLFKSVDVSCNSIFISISYRFQNQIFCMNVYIFKSIKITNLLTPLPNPIDCYQVHAYIFAVFVVRNKHFKENSFSVYSKYCQSTHIQLAHPKGTLSIPFQKGILPYTTKELAEPLSNLFKIVERLQSKCVRHWSKEEIVN